MVVTDPRQADNPIVLANQAFLDLTGYGAEEVIGRNCRFLQGEGTSAAVVGKIRDAIADRTDATIEILNYKKDGSPFWNQLHVSAIHDDAGELLYFFASQDDVTEFHKVRILEATEHRLLKEVDHRARNVLAVVDGIVRLSRAEDATLYAAAIQQRVQALAAAHTLLSDQGWKEVALGRILQQQVDALALGRVRLAGPNVMVPALAVQPLALVIHELLFNATLHGALSIPSGMVSVRWAEAAQAGGFELTWVETNGPAPSQARRPGFGTMMMRGIIERQLRGAIRRDWSDNGLTVKIVVPGDSIGEGDPNRR